jgi:hypothetical protein
MRGYVFDPAERSGIRLTGDLPEPEPAADELLLDVQPGTARSCPAPEHDRPRHHQMHQVSRRWHKCHPGAKIIEKVPSILRPYMPV